MQNIINSYSKSYFPFIWLTKRKTGLHYCRPELHPKHKIIEYLPLGGAVYVQSHTAEL